VRTGALRRAWPLAGLLGAVALAGGLLAGCGPETVSREDMAAGKQKFTQVCGGCHMLADAKTEGRTGPDLDDAFRASREAGWKDSQFQGVVQEWIKIAQPPMPKSLVTGQDAVNVAAYVASVAGTSPDSPVLPAPPGNPGAVQPPFDLPAPPGDTTPREKPPPTGTTGTTGTTATTGTTGTTAQPPAAAGNAAAGKAVFAANCSPCHGATGHGGGGGPDLTSIPSAKDPAVVKHQVINGGGGMPPFGGTLSPKEIDDVTAYVTQQITK
jgi:mono/diheme cytochrome c family protein